MSNKIKDFKLICAKLDEVLKLEKNAVNRDSAIKRFELAYDLCWKTLKELAREKGLECNSPRDCFKTGFQLGFIKHETKWLDMINDRNETVHIYNEKLAEKIYKILPDYLELFQLLLKELNGKRD